MSERKKVCLPWNDYFGGGDDYELIPFTPDPRFPEQKGCFLLKAVEKKADLNKMTKKELIKFIEEKGL